MTNGATLVPRTIEETLSDPSPGLVGRIRIPEDGPMRTGLLEQLSELLMHHHGPGALEWHIPAWMTIEWRWICG